VIHKYYLKLSFFFEALRVDFEVLKTELGPFLKPVLWDLTDDLAVFEEIWD